MTMTQDKQILIEENINFAYYKAHQWASKSCIPEDEAESAALFGLTLAAKKYTPDKNASFITFAALVIDSQIKMYLRKIKNHRNTILTDFSEFELTSDNSHQIEDMCQETDFIQIFNKLPDKYRQIVLDLADKKSKAEICEKYGYNYTSLAKLISEIKDFISFQLNS